MNQEYEQFVKTIDHYQDYHCIMEIQTFFDLPSRFVGKNNVTQSSAIFVYKHVKRRACMIGFLC